MFTPRYYQTDLCKPAIFGFMLFVLFINHSFALEINTGTYQLVIDENSILTLPNSKKMVIPKEWLYPKKALLAERDSYVTSFNYSKSITHFSISPNWIGLHISSWEYSAGSAMAAAGRDVFLIYNEKENKLYNGNMPNTVTKSRHRFIGCFFATFHNFVIGDINQDGYQDIGVIKENFNCEEKFDEKEQIDRIIGPNYSKSEIQWFIFNNNKWQENIKFHGIIPDKPYYKLPLIEMTKTPIEFIFERLKRREMFIRKQAE